jgi:predicted metal-binding membrane protein
LRRVLLGDHVADVVVGTGNVGYMLVLGAIMALEKNAPWGRQLSHPLGFGLLSWAAIITAVNTT